MVDIDNGIKTIIENCGNTMFVKLTSEPTVCTIVGWGISKNLIRKHEDELFILGYKNKHNGVDFPVDSLKEYTIVYNVKDEVKEHYIKLPFNCAKIFKGKIISCFV